MTVAFFLGVNGTLCSVIAAIPLGVKGRLCSVIVALLSMSKAGYVL